MSLEVITPSYRPDLELCRDLRDSVLRWAGPDVRHTLVVPRRDHRRFAALADGIVDVRLVDDYLPSLIPLPRNVWVNPHRPLPPVRGWVAQQIVKLEAAARSRADVVLLADSDLVFVRAFGTATFMHDGRVELYRAAGAVGHHLPRHVVWHRVARALLGLPPDERPALPDYVAWPCAWDPGTVRAALARVEEVAGRPWRTVVGSCVHFSEMVLYGVYVDAFTVAPAAAPMRALAYSDETPLGPRELSGMLGRLREEHVAVMVSAKSGTDLGVRRAALGALVDG